MPEPCAIAECKRSSCALCYCCQQSICLQHLNEHNTLLINQLNPLVDQINGIGDRLKEIDIEDKVGNCRQKLERWRNDCHKKIDQFFEQKCQELNECVTGKVEKQQEEVDRIQSKIGALIREEDVSRQDIDLFTSNIRKLEQELNQLEYTRFDCETQSLIIDESWIHLKESNMNRFDLSNMSPVCKTMNYTEKSRVLLSSNDRYVLIHQSPNLCLIDQRFEIVHRAGWNYGGIRSMCWSSSSGCFIIVSEEGVFAFDESTLSVDKLQLVKEQKWYSCTCFNSSLYLSTYELASSILKYNMLPKIEFIKEWKSPDTCGHEEWITDIKCNRKSIALLIRNPSEKPLVIELRNIETFSRLWSFQIDCLNVVQKQFYVCLVNDDEWLIMDHDSDRLVHITKDGKMKSSQSYKPSVRCAAILCPDLIVISTSEGIKFHDF